MKGEVDISREDRSDGINQTQEPHWEKQALWRGKLRAQFGVCYVRGALWHVRGKEPLGSGLQDMNG